MKITDPMELLSKLVEVENWIKTGDSRGRPFLDADAARLEDGRVSFHPQRFEAVLETQ